MRRLTAAIFAALALAGCAAPEQAILERFFAASRLRDATALQTVATTIFEPHEHGILRGFEIVDVTPIARSGQVERKAVTIDARVVLPDGRLVQQPITVTLEKGPPGGAWIVTGFRDAEASPSAPPS